ncbi:hypothetical protein FRACYDRAFT_246354 [Fragilariopsis cylindrus CCMP1102]|uniref:Uncharacterized protein n=1 Tax=Fragilariopsis cylindrus CCMP1102 TaxID=635003 RepID=A0A1E7EZ44_9STRA|nr:hypothetical protein FRACYDRAFT_246354 [Fragilariopsis cylindrus CCMP1102]|eukprot:OEU11241.1 hypothetical protein FRACYDRAFT_246354 [Fragilariopsis cylindrus CCMP1102]
MVRSMIRGTTGCFYFGRRLAMTATVTSQQPLYYYHCSSSKTSFPTTSNDNSERQRQQRFFSTNNNDGNDGDNSGHDVKSSSSSSTYTQLLTEATAKQLQGDVPSAIKLTIQALEIMKEDVHANDDDDNENEIAETILFLGKLYQLENQFENAVESFEKARDLFDSGSSGGSSRKKRYFTSITHLAYAQKELGQYNVSERNYLYSLKGLEILGGYTDGMTNHTCYELSQLYKAQHKFRKAIDVLETMKMNLSNVFGKTDSKVLQLNSELANLLILLETQEQSQEKQPSSSAVIMN